MSKQPSGRLERRVAKCKINDVCCYRTNLCKVSEGCCGSLLSRSLTGTSDPEGAMLVADGEVILVRDGVAMRYAIGPKERAFMAAFDAGMVTPSTLTLDPPLKREGRAVIAFRARQRAG
jgi:hypothetical protein